MKQLGSYWTDFDETWYLRRRRNWACHSWGLRPSGMSRCATSQKSEDLNYTAVEAWDLNYILVRGHFGLWSWGHCCLETSGSGYPLTQRHGHNRMNLLVDTFAEGWWMYAVLSFCPVTSLKAQILKLVTLSRKWSSGSVRTGVEICKKCVGCAFACAALAAGFLLFCKEFLIKGCRVTINGHLPDRFHPKPIV